MAGYRAYTIGENGHFTGVTEMVCDDDACAIKLAKELMNGRTIEVWEAARLVATLTPDETRSDSFARQIEQSKRLSSAAGDPTTKERLEKLTADLERGQKQESTDWTSGRQKPPLVQDET